MCTGLSLFLLDKLCALSFVHARLIIDRLTDADA